MDNLALVYGNNDIAEYGGCKLSIEDSKGLASPEKIARFEQLSRIPKVSGYIDLERSIEDRLKALDQQSSFYSLDTLVIVGAGAGLGIGLGSILTIRRSSI